MTDYWFRCPECRRLATLDADQANGRVSIVCECGWHRTGVVSPLMPSTERVGMKTTFRFQEGARA